MTSQKLAKTSKNLGFFLILRNVFDWLKKIYLAQLKGLIFIYIKEKWDILEKQFLFMVKKTKKMKNCFVNLFISQQWILYWLYVCKYFKVKPLGIV